MFTTTDLQLIEQMFTLLTKVNVRLLSLGISNIPEIQKALNIVNSGDSKGMSNIRIVLSNGFRRLDEMGLNDTIIDTLSSETYILAKSQSLFNNS